MTRSRVLLALAACVWLLAGCVAPAAPTPESSGGTVRQQASVPPGWVTAEVVRVVDGDTLVVRVDGREARVRYVGVDTPESVQRNTPVECFGREASRENEQLVGGRTVYLERDISDTDRYGRLLRYVHVDDPATGQRLLVELELVRRGYAHAVTYPPDVKYADQLRAAEREAREARRGLWGSC